MAPPQIRDDAFPVGSGLAKVDFSSTFYQKYESDRNQNRCACFALTVSSRLSHLVCLTAR